MIYQGDNILLAKNIRFKASIFKSDLCDYIDAHIVVIINVRATANTDGNKKYSAFKNYVTFRSCITTFNSTFTNNAENLDIVMQMYNLLEYSQNCFMSSRCLWNYYREKINDVDDNVSDGKSFKYKTKIIGKIQARYVWLGNPENADRPAQP